MASCNCGESEAVEEEVGLKSEHELLSGRVKQFHAKLRHKLRIGKKDVTAQWRELLDDRDELKEYSTAMHLLAVGPWDRSGSKDGGGRIEWCVGVCYEYFTGSHLQKSLLKDLRRVGHGMPTVLSDKLLPESAESADALVKEFASRAWTLLDVGSCYNPFERFSQFNVTAIDIAPAVESVRKCDFLNVDIEPPLRPCISAEEEAKLRKQSGGEVDAPTPDCWLQQLPAESFDVVVFSLLLSYFPATQQRMQCCINAHKVVRPHGLLLVVTPDSSHQNRHADMMKSWKSAIEGIGFHRWKYIKETHLHCMAFRKTTGILPGDHYRRVLENHSLLYIPQDSHELGGQPESDVNARLFPQGQPTPRQSFEQLPFGCSDALF